MELNTQEILNAQFYTLPLAVQDIINENEWKSLIKDLAANYRLHQDQIEITETVTLLTMLGFADTKHFAQNLVEAAKIDTSIANEMSKRIDLEVFEILEQTALLVAAEQEESLDDDSLLVLDDAHSKSVNTEGLDDLDLSEESDRAAQKLLEEIENPQNFLSDETQEKAATQLQDHFDGMIDGEDPQVQETNPVDAPAEPQSAPVEEKRPATHMRTLKSDIVKEKLQNPSWDPQVTKQTDEDLASITQDALKETQKKSIQNPNPHKQGKPQDSGDLYREQI